MRVKPVEFHENRGSKRCLLSAYLMMHRFRVNRRLDYDPARWRRSCWCFLCCRSTSPPMFAFSLWWRRRNCCRDRSFGRGHWHALLLHVQRRSEIRRWYSVLRWTTSGALYCIIKQGTHTKNTKCSGQKETFFLWEWRAVCFFDRVESCGSCT